jgi:hypothetical protein
MLPGPGCLFSFFQKGFNLGRSKMFHLLNAKGSVPRAVIGVRGRQTYLYLWADNGVRRRFSYL